MILAERTPFSGLNCKREEVEVAVEQEVEVAAEQEVAEVQGMAADQAPNQEPR